MADRIKPDRYYDAPSLIDISGPTVTRAAGSGYYWFTDEYRGTLEELARVGLLPIGRFPGQPGQNAVSASLRPRGVATQARGMLDRVPGHMHVTRGANGAYLIRLTVSLAEQEARTAALALQAALATQRKEEGKEAAAAVMRELFVATRERHQSHWDALREWCEEGMTSQGRWWLQSKLIDYEDADYLERENVPVRTSRFVVLGLRYALIASTEQALAEMTDFASARAVLMEVAVRAGTQA